MSQKEGAADPASSPLKGHRIEDMAAFEVSIFSGDTLIWRARLNGTDDRAVRGKAFELMEQGGGHRPQLPQFPKERLKVTVEALDKHSPASEP